MLLLVVLYYGAISVYAAFPMAETERITTEHRAKICRSIVLLLDIFDRLLDVYNKAINPLKHAHFCIYLGLPRDNNLNFNHWKRSIAILEEQIRLNRLIVRRKQ
eukprot:8350289-Pyramimonas_sp.AAC.1